MKKATKITLIVGLVLVAVGLVLLAVGAFITDYHNEGDHMSTLHTNTHIPAEPFENIRINSHIANVRLIPSEDDECRVVCKETDKLYHKVTVEGRTLFIRGVDDRLWFEKLGSFFGTMEVTVYLPRTAYASLTAKTDTGSVEIPASLTFGQVEASTATGHIAVAADVTGALSLESDTGSVHVQNVTPQSLTAHSHTGQIEISSVKAEAAVKLTTDTGRITLTDVTAGHVAMESDTGSVTMNQTIVTDVLHIETDTGSITLNECDAAEIDIESDTGSVKATLLTGKIFFARSDTGRVSVPHTTTGGPCRIKTDTGSIRCEIVSS